MIKSLLPIMEDKDTRLMKCWNCGAELQDGVLFCRECGSKVSQQEIKKFCRECGHELQQDAKFCSFCGTKVESINSNNNSPQKYDYQYTDFETSKSGSYPSTTQAVPTIRSERHTETVEKPIITKEKKKNPSCLKTLTIITLIVVLIAVALTVLTGNIPKFNNRNAADDYSPQIETDTESVFDFSQFNSSGIEDYTIEKGVYYAYMSDLWDLYLAYAISDSIVKIEHWHKTLATEKEMKLRDDLGVYKLNDPKNGFSWIDNEHLAFTFILQDEDNGEGNLEKPTNVIFTINISEKNESKGSNFDKKLICYSYQNDDWHLYRAIPLTNDLMKFEVWSRISSKDNFMYGYDAGVIDIHNPGNDFEWTDDSQTAFTITMQDPANRSYWEKPALVAFINENENYIYSNLLSFLGKSESHINSSASISETVVPVTINEFTEAPTNTVIPTDTQEPTKTTVPTATPFPTPTATLAPTATKKPESVTYSTNDMSTVKNGNSGVYSYKSRGGTYSNYLIIDFNEGYVYSFSEGNGNTICDRVRIESGNLNNVLIITYHDGGDVWSYGLHFKFKNIPDHLILQDNDGFEYDFYPTNLSDAISIKNQKTIIDY